jgi:fluoride ion exporter CrcB/FEX
VPRRGGAARELQGGLGQKVEVPGMPAGRLYGCLAETFLLGLVLTLVLARWRLSWDIRPFLTTGILGSFTTFSNLTLDVVVLVLTWHEYRLRARQSW